MQKRQHVHPFVSLCSAGLRGEELEPHPVHSRSDQPIPTLEGGSSWRETMWARGKPKLQAQAHLILLLLPVLGAGFQRG